ncbi:MAG: hypothetical protein KGZ97_01160 [Bacteroidetes bacterium]|nr:hypothetical protein [Bacteroidota bacterium]
MKINQFLYILIASSTLGLFLFSCTNQMDKDEALSHLKAFDNEIIRLHDKLVETRPYLALKKLKTINNIPLPFFLTNQSEITDTIEYNFTENKGIFEHNVECNMFEKKADSDSLVLLFKDAVNRNADVRLIVTEYDAKSTASNFNIPTSLKAEMYIGNQQAMEINHYAEVNYGMPLKIDFKGKFDEYNISIQMSTKLRKKSGKLQCEILISGSSGIILTWNVDANLGFEDDASYYINKLLMKVELFPVIIDINVYNKGIGRHSVDYVSDFNKNSRIKIYSKTDGRTIGIVKLKTRPGSDKLDFVVYYKDGSYEYIDDFIISIRRIMSIKT